jgi:glycosyltransferase involved in cell wall biosynthesis
MLRIAFIDVTATVSYGGLQTAVWRLAQQLSAMGHEVTVFGGEGPIGPPAGCEKVAVRTFPFVPRERFPDLGSRFQRIGERLSFARQARRAVAAGDYDWIVLDKPFDFFWPRLLPRGRRTRFVFMSGGTDFFPGDRRLAQGIDVWCACSHFNAWQIHARYKRWPTVIYYGVDTDRFTPSARDERLRKALGVTPETVLFAFAGRLVGWKGMAVAVRALAEPMLAGLPIKLLVIGDGPERAALERLARTLGVSERLILHPPVPHDRLPAYYASAEAGVFPSIGDEAFGITIAEAMSSGLPVIASHIGGIPEVVGNEASCGLLVPPADPAALAAAMRYMAIDSVRRTNLGQAARARIEKLFTWKHAAERLLAALETSRHATAVR